MKQLNATTKEYLKMCGQHDINVSFEIEAFNDDKMSEETFDGELFIGDMNDLNTAFEAVRNTEFFTWQTLIDAFTDALIEAENENC